ncbi:MAG: energy transducer TonB [Bradymonadaceae bacterium]
MWLRRSIAISALLHAGMLLWAFQSAHPTPSKSESSLEKRLVEVSIGSKSARPTSGFARPTSVGPTSASAGQEETGSKEDESKSESDSSSDPSTSTKPKPSPSSESETEESDAEAEPPAETPPESAPPSPAPGGESPSEEPSEREKDDSQQQPDKPDSTSPDPADDSNASAPEKVARNRASDSQSGEGSSAGSGSSGSASGSGSGSGAATGGRAGGGGIDRDALIRGYSRKIYRRLRAHQTYPRTARRRSLEGTVMVEVTVGRDGAILDADIHRSSGHEILDRAALEAIQSLDKLPPPPEALAWDRKALRIPIKYQLSRRG